MQAFVVLVFILVFDCSNCIACHSSYFQIVLVGIGRFLIFMAANERSMSLLPTNFELARSKLMQASTLMKQFGHGWVLVDCDEGTSLAGGNPSSFSFFCRYCLLDLVNFSSQHDCSSSLQLILGWC
jgi:hypothetical protein